MKIECLPNRHQNTADVAQRNEDVKIIEAVDGEAGNTCRENN